MILSCDELSHSSIGWGGVLDLVRFLQYIDNSNLNQQIIDNIFSNIIICERLKFILLYSKHSTNNKLIAKISN